MISLMKPTRIVMRDNPQSSSQSLMGLMSSLANPARSMIDSAAMGAKSAANTAYGSMMRNMSRMGINPQSPRFVGQMRKMAAGRAAMEASARNEASRDADQVAYGRFQGLLGAAQGAESQRASQRAAANQQAQTFNMAMMNRTDAKRDSRQQAEAQAAEAKAAQDVIDAWNRRNPVMGGVAPREPNGLNGAMRMSQLLSGRPSNVSVTGV